MDFISHYQQNCSPCQKNNFFRIEKLFPSSLRFIDLIKLISFLKRQFKLSGITFSDVIQDFYLKGNNDYLMNQFSALSVLDDYRNIWDSNSIEFYLLESWNIFGYEFYIRVNINLEASFFQIISNPTKNGQILSIKQKNILLSVNRYLIAQNAHLNYGCIHLSPKSGQLRISISNQYDSESLKNLLKQPTNLNKKLRIDLGYLKKHWSLVLGKILYFMNIEIKKIGKNSTSIKQYIKQKQKQFNQISKEIKISHIQKSFFYCKENKLRFQSLSDQEINIKNLEKQSLISSLKFNSSNFMKSIRNILRIYGKKLTKECYNFEPDQQCKAIFRQKFSPQFLMSKYPLYSQLKITKIFKQVNLITSGFSSLSIIEVLAKRQQDKYPILSQVARKRAQPDRLNHQKKIINILKDKRCLFISRYYSVNIQKMSESIFLQYCSQKSIETYILLNREFVSLETKLFFLFQISIGLKFLRDYGIVHMDIKPQNILIKIVSDNYKHNTTFLLRIIDFGQSYTSAVTQQFKRGCTIPYAAPEILFGAKKFTQKTDVFSFGVTMMEILFNHYPLDIRRVGSQIYNEEGYLKYYTLCIEKCKALGFGPLMESLFLLALKCLNPSPKYRPCLDSLCSIIQQALANLKKQYQ